MCSKKDVFEFVLSMYARMLFNYIHSRSHKIHAFVLQRNVCLLSYLDCNQQSMLTPNPTWQIAVPIVVVITVVGVLAILLVKLCIMGKVCNDGLIVVFFNQTCPQRQLSIDL